MLREDTVFEKQVPMTLLSTKPSHVVSLCLNSGKRLHLVSIRTVSYVIYIEMNQGVSSIAFYWNREF